MIRVLQYGAGNVGAFLSIYHRLNIACGVATTPDDMKDATRLILPGVGSFDWAMDRLNRSGMRESLDELVQVRKVPILGICVGMQMMARASEEGVLPGLGWVDGKVRRFDPTMLGHRDRLPHMGWSTARPVSHAGLFAGMDEWKFYFLHSYYFDATRPEDVLATTRFGIEFASACRRDNVHGVQFHPEKSHDWGISLLKNFAEL